MSTQLISPQPSLRDPIVDNIPNTLRGGFWCVWQAVWQPKRGKYDKIPSNGAYRISTARSDQWLTFDQAASAYEDNPDVWGGIGKLVVQGENLIYVDIDGDTSPGWQDYLFRTYCEISPSGNGLRLIGTGAISRDISSPIEIYGGHAARFLTITGHVTGQPLPVSELGNVTQAYINKHGVTQSSSQSVDEAMPEILSPRDDWPELTFDEDDDRSAVLIGKINNLYRSGRTDEEVFSILTNSDDVMHMALDHRSQREDKALDYLWSQCQKSKDYVRNELAVIFKDAPYPQDGLLSSACNSSEVAVIDIEVEDFKAMTLAGVFLRSENSLWGVKGRYLINYQDIIYEYLSGGYSATERGWIKHRLWKFLPHCYYWVTPDDGEPYKQYNAPTTAHVNNVTNAVAALVHEERHRMRPPFWRDQSVYEYPDANNIIPFINGYLDRTTRRLYEPTPNLFCTSTLDFAYQVDAPDPVRWMQFLEEAWPDDISSRLLLQEIFGYILSGDTRLQKIFILIGIKRSGKGTIARVLARLMGSHNISGITLNQVGKEFGMQGLIDKKLWLIGDARIGKGADQGTIVERLLTISGEDLIDIPRKHIGDWSGILSARIMLLSNSVPKLYEPSGAMSARLIPLKFTQSFEGREDKNLTDDLCSELSGILLWALDGLDRLVVQGKFTETDAGKELKENFERMSDPLHGFIGEVLAPDPNGSILTSMAFSLWQDHRIKEGIGVATSKRAFTALLQEVLPSVTVEKRQIDGMRETHYVGLRVATIVPEAMSSSVSVIPSPRVVPL